MIWLAKKMGMKVMIYANGIGPINRRANRKLTNNGAESGCIIRQRRNTLKV
jgi:polysaccharide pyruvyl transferase WcaK-like protein